MAYHKDMGEEGRRVSELVSRPACVCVCVRACGRACVVVCVCMCVHHIDRKCFLFCTLLNFGCCAGLVLCCYIAEK